MSYSKSVSDALSKKAQTIIKKYPKKRSAIMPLLHLIQTYDGYVSDNGKEFVANKLNITKLEVDSVASFYTMFKKKENGQYTIGVCKTALCAVMGGDELLKSLSKYLSIKPGETTKDKMFTLEEIECNAACEYAPVAMFNWEFIDNATPYKITRMITRIKNGENVRPTRTGATDVKIKKFEKIAKDLKKIK